MLNSLFEYTNSISSAGNSKWVIWVNIGKKFSLIGYSFRASFSLEPSSSANKYTNQY